MTTVPKWSVKGDWFDTCKCSIPCPCYFAQPPTAGDCDGVLAWHIRKGNYGDVSLDGLNVLALGYFKGNIWGGGDTRVTMGMFIDERADERQREALQMIFGGQAGGWPGMFATLIGEVRGIEFCRIDFEIADDLTSWRAEIPGKVLASAEALTGPTSVPGKLVQVHNPAGAEVGPGAIATQGKATADKANAFGFKWERVGRSSKHMGFDWSGPDGGPS
ncbi:MAG TPA: DUF1326 domain-containing protein [Steroidobacteraceae bacterium]|nr:DUF1326 domain-containing protein [Steroidobacteraceae bacterium]